MLRVGAGPVTTNLRFLPEDCDAGQDRRIGLGLAFARYALDRGYNVVTTGRSVGKLEVRQCGLDGRQRAEEIGLHLGAKFAPQTSP
jgi:hypothetical protein